MQKVSLSNKVFTENPLLDEIIYNARQIVAGGVIVKDEDKANKNETLDSVTDGDILVAINSGRGHFRIFKYTATFLSQFYSAADALKYSLDNSLIPEADRDKIYKAAYNDFTNNYVEYNNYYRMLHGEPNYDETGIYEGLWIDTRCIDTSTATSIDDIYYMNPAVGTDEEDEYTLIHKLSDADKNIIYENGTCENIINASSKLAEWGMSKDDAMYVMHIGDREVDYYTARAAEKFGLLYCPDCSSEEVKIRFKDLFEANRMYMLYTIYSRAYKYRSDYYDNFMMVFLIIQTVIDMIVELPEYIIRRDIFDTRTCKYIFESNGVKYFKDIPLKYQISLVKNLNKLIKFKSTDKCIVDIVSLFGTENIEVFKYYILKDRYVKDPLALDYYDNKTTTTTSEGYTKTTEDNSANYDLKFIKVPMLGNYDDYIRTNKNIYSYDTLTDTDGYWIGDQDYDTVKKDIKDLDFTVLRSKYYSIEAVIDLAKKNFTVAYFMNILMYNKVDSSALLVNLPNISTTKQFTLVNTILTLFSLSYIYYGVEDSILDSRAKTAQILGFNMEADLSKIASWLNENHYGLSLVDVKLQTQKSDGTVENNFISADKIVGFNELQNIFFKNKDCYDHVISVMTNPPSKDIYDAYKYIYNALMTTNRNMEYFLLERSVVNEYKALGYTTKFINIPQPNKYHNVEDYKRDYKILLNSIESTDLCFDMNDDFDNNHKFNLYVKNEDGSELAFVGTATMAYTYKEFLSANDSTLFGFINNILSISNTEARQEACINAIQSIVSYLKDYIDQDGDDAIPLDTVFSGIPSISVDFIKKYVTEVIDFFKSFKIFTHESSITYVIQSKFGNYVQLIEKLFLKYLLDKSELVKIEDAIGPKIKNVGGKLVYSGNGIDTDLTMKDKHELIDKVWFNISTWLEKNYSEYYRNDDNIVIDSKNSTSTEPATTASIDTFGKVYLVILDNSQENYTKFITEAYEVGETNPEIKYRWVNSGEFESDIGVNKFKVSLHDTMERFGTYIFTDSVFTEKYLEYIQDYAVDAIGPKIKLVEDADGKKKLVYSGEGLEVSISPAEYVAIMEEILTQENHELNDYYNEWITDLVYLLDSKTIDDKTYIQDDMTRFSTHTEPDQIGITDGRESENASFAFDNDSLSIDDSLYTIITQTYPAHSFDE